MGDRRSGGQIHPPAVTPPRRVVVGIARDIESLAIAKETIERLELRMTPYELLQNLTVKPGGSTFAIRISYRDPTAKNPQRARRIVLTVAEVAGERIRKETPYDYEWVL